MSSFRVAGDHLCVRCRMPAPILSWTLLKNGSKEGPHCGRCYNEMYPWPPKKVKPTLSWWKWQFFGLQAFFERLTRLFRTGPNIRKRPKELEWD